MSVTITLNSGAKIKADITPNGYASTDNISRETFSRRELVKIHVAGTIPSEDGSSSVDFEQENLKLAMFLTENGTHNFSFSFVPKNELEREQITANIAYLAMMTDTELD